MSCQKFLYIYSENMSLCAYLGCGGVVSGIRNPRRTHQRLQTDNCSLHLRCHPLPKRGCHHDTLSGFSCMYHLFQQAMSKSPKDGESVSAVRAVQCHALAPHSVHEADTDCKYESDEGPACAMMFSRCLELWMGSAADTCSADDDELNRRPPARLSSSLHAQVKAPWSKCQISSSPSPMRHAIHCPRIDTSTAIDHVSVCSVYS